MIVSNSATSTTGKPVGIWAAELIHPYDVFKAAGCQVTIASSQGGPVELDPLSDPRDSSGFSSLDILSARYLTQSTFADQLSNTPAIADLNTHDYDAIFVCGGQGTLYTFPEDQALTDLFVSFYQDEKPSATLCRGACLLLNATLDNGEPLIQGKMITGFSKKEEQWMDQNVGPMMVPFVLEEEAKKRGAKFVASSAFTPFAMQDGNLITGQQRNSGFQTAGLVLKALDLDFDEYSH
ncbi:type 1 glutamine amidotransferase domain-containing protein [Acaryochloris sp. CCMEE 5410]|uniref:type 1 glutamine amidotransferase domain-containing protein n=1 Tax=Acaryochloris sp. CCMEE 5410 TaxID=310037 RepID=UPI00024847E8|nr:type 1 glutamine amidotransferase domain-containing protein [Acaryochloris sp. CCMEE 5410]